MVSIASLWLPILLSAVAVFVVSSIIHMFLGYHSADYRRLPAEDDFMAAVRKLDIPPGDYMVPCPDEPCRIQGAGVPGEVQGRARAR